MSILLCYNANFFNKNTNISENFFWHILLVITCRIMFADSPQCKVRQRTKKDVAASRAMIMNRHVIPEGNVVRADIMVAPLNGIHEII
jgi:hypothetical protein